VVKSLTLYTVGFIGLFKNYATVINSFPYWIALATIVKKCGSTSTDLPTAESVVSNDAIWSSRQVKIDNVVKAVKVRISLYSHFL
jgi:hypothetical protein